MPSKNQCTGTTKTGQQCRRAAAPGTEPPRCRSHIQQKRKPGAPPGNQNATKHGLYAKSPATKDLDEQIADLEHKYTVASLYIDQEDLPLEDYLRATTLLSQIATRIQRLCDKRDSLRGDTGTAAEMKDALSIIWHHLDMQIPPDEQENGTHAEHS